MAASNSKNEAETGTEVVSLVDTRKIAANHLPYLLCLVLVVVWC